MSIIGLQYGWLSVILLNYRKWLIIYEVEGVGKLGSESPKATFWFSDSLDNSQDTKQRAQSKINEGERCVGPGTSSRESHFSGVTEERHNCNSTLSCCDTK